MGSIFVSMLFIETHTNRKLHQQNTAGTVPGGSKDFLTWKKGDFFIRHNHYPYTLLTRTDFVEGLLNGKYRLL